MNIDHPEQEIRRPLLTRRKWLGQAATACTRRRRPWLPSATRDLHAQVSRPATPATISAPASTISATTEQKVTAAHSIQPHCKRPSMPALTTAEARSSSPPALSRSAPPSSRATSPCISPPPPNFWEALTASSITQSMPFPSRGDTTLNDGNWALLFAVNAKKRNLRRPRHHRRPGLSVPLARSRPACRPAE